MDLNENGSLLVLEQLMEEFFNPATSNSRKHEIEQQLTSLKATPQLWKLCLYIVTNTSSQYVTMFALSTLETVINQQWANMDWSYREELKNVLHNFLLEKANTSPHFLRGKYAKLLVDIAKQDWPDRYPNFMLNIIELLKSEPNQLIGLILLRTMSEEFMGMHAGFENGRRNEITRLLQPYIPVVFELLTQILINLGTKPRHTATATPPPSPTHPSSPPSISQQLMPASFKPDSRALKKEVLNTVQQLFTWVPVSQIPPRIIKAIFQFTNISSYAQDDDDMCVLAMSTVNELLYRKGTPPDSQEFFIHLYNHTLELLRDIAFSSTLKIDTADEGYNFVEKLSELLVLLIEQHLWHLEMEPNFSAIDFLSPLFVLTMQLPSTQYYLRCLSVWAAFIKQIKPANAQKYLEPLLELVAALLKKLQFSYNANQLKKANNTDVDDDNETEWSMFLKNTIEVIAMVAEFAPVQTFNQVLLPWENANNTYKGLENIIDHASFSLNLGAQETERLCYILRDFSTLTQTLARLSSLFIDQDNEDLTSSEVIIGNLVDKLLVSASLSTRAKFYNLKSREPRLTDCFIDIHSEFLAASKTWLVWMTQNNRMSDQNLKLLIDLTVPLFHDGSTVPSRLSHSAAHLFITLTNIVFPPTLVVLPSVMQLIHFAPGLKFSDPQTKYVIESAITNLLLRSWGDLSQDDATQRNFLIGVFFDSLTREFRELTPSSSEVKVCEVIGSTMPSLSHIVDYSKDFPMVSKKMLYMSVKNTIEHALVLFPSYVKYNEVNNHMLIFFLNVLRVLQQQLGMDGTKNAVEVFLQVAASEQQSNNLVGIDKLLQILQLIVESPGSSYKSFLPGILQLCMENLYPLIVAQANDHPDVFIALLTLLYSVLLHRWQYFYMSQVRLGYSPGCSESDTGPDSPQKPEQLLAVLQVFGQALLHQDINIFRLSLAALEDLNSKWKLYHKALFRDHLLSNFLNVLLKTLIEKSQALLADEVQVAIYNMAMVNYEGFTTFLQHFIHSIDGVSQHHWEALLRNFIQNHDRDMPTFIQHLQKFVNSIQQVRLCN